MKAQDLKRIIININKTIISSTKKRAFGSFEEKEIAKEYFRNLNRLIFSFESYEKNRYSIEKWLSKK